MQTVMVEFAVGADRVDACLRAVEDITRNLAANQPEFHGSVIHHERATGTVWNIMTWGTHQAFIDFRDTHADRIGAVLGAFGPKGRMLDIAASVQPKRS